MYHASPFSRFVWFLSRTAFYLAMADLSLENSRLLQSYHSMMFGAWLPNLFNHFIKNRFLPKWVVYSNISLKNWCPFKHCSSLYPDAVSFFCDLFYRIYILYWFRSTKR